MNTTVIAKTKMEMWESYLFLKNKIEVWAQATE